MLEPADDTAIMAFLLDANSGRYDLAEVAQRFLGEPIVDASPSLFDSTTSDETLTYEVALIARLREHLRAEIAQWELNFVYEQIELPLVMVLGLMEARGVRVDVELLRTIAKEFTEEAASLDKQIQKVAGHEFKVNSPAATPDGPLRRDGPHRGEEDQVGLLDRRLQSRGHPGRAQDHSLDPALPRGRETARHLRRAADRRGAEPTVASTRRSNRWSRAPADSPRTVRTCTTSPCAPRRVDDCATPSCRARAGRWRSRTTTRSNCGSSRTSPRTRACSRPSRPTRTCTARSPPRSSPSRRPTSRPSSANRPRPSPTDSPTAWRPSASVDDSAYR